jgi:hypothetical protein
VSNSFSLSKVNSLKGICSSKRKTRILEQLQDTLDNLNCMILDMKELVVFMTSYPRLYYFDIHFWCKLLVFLRGLIKWHVSTFGDHPVDSLNQNRPAHLGRMVRTSEEIVVHHQYERSSQEEIPKIELRCVLYGSVKPPAGRLDALACRSPTTTISILVRFEI